MKMAGQVRQPAASGSGIKRGPFKAAAAATAAHPGLHRSAEGAPGGAAHEPQRGVQLVQSGLDERGTLAGLLSLKVIVTQVDGVLHLLRLRLLLLLLLL